MSEEIEIFLFKACPGAAEGAPLPERKRVVSAAARNFVRIRAAQLTGQRYDSIIFVQGPHGKPYIEGSGVHFSLSHCGNLVLTAFSDREIGADIELVSFTGQSVVQRIFTQGERDYIAVAPSEAAAQRRFCEIWTAKEAFLKLHGVGLSGGLDFDTAVGGGLLDSITSERWGSAEIFRKRVDIEMMRGDFLPRIGEVYQNRQAEFQISVCADKIGNVVYQFVE